MRMGNGNKLKLKTQKPPGRKKESDRRETENRKKGGKVTLKS